MKEKVFLMILASLVLISCGSKSKKSEEEDKTVELKPYNLSFG